MSDSFAIPWPARLLCYWDSGKNAEVHCHFLLPQIFLSQGSNLCLLHWQEDSLPLNHQGSPIGSLPTSHFSPSTPTPFFQLLRCDHSLPPVSLLPDLFPFSSPGEQVLLSTWHMAHGLGHLLRSLRPTADKHGHFCPMSLY